MTELEKELLIAILGKHTLSNQKEFEKELQSLLDTYTNVKDLYASDAFLYEIESVLKRSEATK